MSNSPRHVPIEESEMFQTYRSVAQWCWKTAYSWKQFEKGTVGKQLVSAADSVGANLVEGDGRYSPAEAIHFFYIARGSARETRYWLTLAADRDLIPRDTAEAQVLMLESATRALNELIKYRKEFKKSLSIKEPQSKYNAATDQAGQDTRHKTSARKPIHSRRSWSES